MKKLCIALVAVMACCSCTSLKDGGVVDILFGKDYYEAGKTVGKAAWFGYVVLKEDGEHEDICARAEEVWAKLDKSEPVDIAVLNNVALEIADEVLAKKYGSAKAGLITEAVRIGGHIADRLMAKKFNKEQADQFVTGVVEGIREEAKDYVPVEPAEKEDEFCPTGNCSAKGLAANAKITYQKKLAKNLLDYAVDDFPEDAEISYKENLEHFVERMTALRKRGKTETKIRVEAYDIKDRKLIGLRLVCPKSDGSAGWEEVDCVECYDLDFDD